MLLVQNRRFYMSDTPIILSQNEVENRIFNCRGLQVMIDSDLAEMYGVETKVLNQAVKRNIERFPDSFRFQLSEIEYHQCSRSQIVTLNIDGQNSKPKRGQNLKYLPYAFTEQGVAMLSAVLRSQTAINVSIQVMNAFVNMRKTIAETGITDLRINKLEVKQLETDEKFEQIFKALENKSLAPEKGVFFDGQIFDAYHFVAELIRAAKQSIVLIDNYIDDTTLTLLSKRNNSATANIYTKNISKALQLDLEKFNTQYKPIEIKELTTAHDRFLLIDHTTMYHIGASLKDLGKKWFAFSKMDTESLVILNKLNEL